MLSYFYDIPGVTKWPSLAAKAWPSSEDFSVGQLHLNRREPKTGPTAFRIVYNDLQRVV